MDLSLPGSTIWGWGELGHTLIFGLCDTVRFHLVSGSFQHLDVATGNDCYICLDCAVMSMLFVSFLYPQVENQIERIPEWCNEQYRS